MAAADAQEQPHPGKAVYDKHCQVCHGPGAQGNAGPALVPFELDDEQLISTVREGGGEMPPFSENRLSDDDVKQIAGYLRSLSPEH
jgi:mono/diheme cytochrome c family protein